MSHVSDQSELPVLQTVELTKRFPQVLANDAISFEVRRGEVHCLLGENGAGKSTLAECLYGYYQPDSGSILFKGCPARFSSPSDAIRQGIGMVHQHFVLAPPLTVIENIIVGTEGLPFFLNLREAEAKIQAICDEYGLDLDLRARVWQLSVGEQQWVEILKALYIGVELLILDEPTAVLTPQETLRFFTILKRMRSSGLSIIFITHKLNEVMQISDRVTVLRRGKWVATVNTADVTTADLACMMVGREVLFRVEREPLPLGDPLLEMRNLHADNDRRQEALAGITLTLHRNEILGLAGVAGNGQKELFEVLVGVRRATSGSFYLGGVDLTNQPPATIMRRGIGHIPDDRIREGLIPDFSVAENLILGQHGDPQYRSGPFLDSRKIEKFAKNCISYFGIATPSPNHPTRVLSGGNLQKVILARELWQCPRCLLANQPTRGLDVGVIEYVHGQLLSKRREGYGILLASEDLEELFNLSDRIAVIFKGQIMGVFRPDEILIEEVGLLMAGVTREQIA